MTRIGTWGGSMLAAMLLITTAAPAATISGVTYVYNNAGDLNAIGGKDAAGPGTAQALTDGLGQAGVYVPSDFFWGGGQEGTIYLESDVNIMNGQPQPRVTFDLGGVYDLGSVVVHYGVRVVSAIEAPASVEIEIDALPIGSFGGFDDSDNVANFGDIRSNTIDLMGYSGQLVTMNFIGNISGLTTANGTTWLGLTEVEFTAVPEPGAFGLMGISLAVAGMAHWRRRS